MSSRIENEFLAEECGVDESEVFNSFANEYECVFVPDMTKSVCGECKFFTNHCTTSYIEAKYGNARTPSCLQFERKLNV